jgi:hypothetical protein
MRIFAEYHGGATDQWHRAITARPTNSALTRGEDTFFLERFVQ